MKVQITAIQVPPSYRFDTGNMEELKTTLQHYGMIHPIVVRELAQTTGFNYELIAGYRRLQAAIALGWSEVPITLLTSKDTLEQFDVSMEENMKRKDFNPLEICELLLQRKRLWEQKHGPIERGRPTLEDKLCTNVHNFFEETGKIFKKSPQEIFRFLRLQGMDEDLKKKLESGEMHFRKALTEQSARKLVASTNSKPTSNGVSGVPEPPMDVLNLQYDIQRVVWQFAGLYQAFKLIDGKEYTLTPLNEERLTQLVGMGSELRDWVSRFNTKVQDALLEKTGCTP
jgi:ParB family chromosome partitioning protein